MSSSGGVDDQLLFLDRLASASPEELDAIGDRLGANADGDGIRRPPIDSLRFALWQAMPGHAGFAPAEAEGRLDRLLTEGRPPRELQALMRVQLRQLRQLQAHAALRTKNTELTADNGRLREEIEALEQQIQELTSLERRMGVDGGGDAE